MKTVILAATLLCASSSLYGGQENLEGYGEFDRQLYRVAPNRGPVSGGTLVTLEGEFNFSGLLDPCAGPQVWIGGRRATRVSASETQIVVRTEPYTHGRFNVTVDTCGATAMLPNAFTYGDLWERALLPIYLAADVHAAHGSIWRTELHGRMLFEGRLTADPERPCPRPGGVCDGYTTFGPFIPRIASDQHVPGRMIYIGKLSRRGAVFNLRVRDVSREAEGLGTELPVVREDDAFGPNETIVIPGVPIDPRYRAKLRIYRMDVGEDSVVTVDAGYRPFDVKLSNEPLTSGFLLYPGYAEVDLDGLPPSAGPGHIDVKVITHDGRYWAFVAVTNNATQQVTTMTP